MWINKNKYRYLYEREYNKWYSGWKCIDKRNITRAINVERIIGNPQIFNEYNCDLNEFDKFLDIYYRNYNVNSIDSFGNHINFGVYYQRICQLAYYCLTETLSEIYEVTLFNSYINVIIPCLEKICTRTLIFEMYVCKESGMLSGSTSEEQYESYLKILEDDKYIDELFELYPVLFRNVMEAIVDFTDYISEVLNHLEADKEEIITKLCGGKPFQTIEKFDANMSDTHNHGRVVMRLYLDNGISIIYKPHSLKNENEFQKFVKWFATDMELPIYQYGIVEKEDHGWTEVIPYKECSSEQEVKNYYTRIGVILFTSYLLGTSDMHYENMIAYGEHPVVIDLETLIGVRAKDTSLSASQLTEKRIEQSVLRLGILPFYTWDKEGNGVNVSALSGDEGQKVPMKVPRIAKPFTSDMHIVYVNPVTEKKSNLLKLNGEHVEAAAYTAQLQDGFRKAYQFALGNKKALEERLQQLSNTHSRHLIRDTQQYSSLLMTSYHPDFMMDGAEREMVMYNLYKDEQASKNDEIVQCEIREMLDGDIPYFYFRPDQTSLYNIRGKEIRNYFPQPPIEGLMEKLAGLNEDDMEFQGLLIEIAMNLSPKKGSHFVNIYESEYNNTLKYSEMPSKEKLLTASKVLADKLLNRAIYNENSEQVNWIGMRLISNKEHRWSIGALDPYLYDGLSGVNIFFHAMARITGEVSYSDMSRQLDQMLFQYTRSIREDQNQIRTPITGCYAGEGSIALAYQYYYQITGDDVYLQYAREHIKAIVHLIEEDVNFDIISGNAGLIVVLLNMYDLTGQKEYLEWAGQAGAHLLSHAQETSYGVGWISPATEEPLAGFSHGNSGIAMALARLGTYIEFPYEEIVEKALQYEENCYHEEKGNWADLRYAENEAEDAVSWCHGAAGILLARRELKRWAPDSLQKWIEKDIQRGIQKTAETPFRKGNCLCHGNCGNVEILQSCAGSTSQCTSYVYQFTEDVLRGNVDFIPQEKENPAFMTGLAGMGYFLLRQIDGNLPHIIMPNYSSSSDSL